MQLFRKTQKVLDKPSDTETIDHIYAYACTAADIAQQRRIQQAEKEAPNFIVDFKSKLEYLGMPEPRVSAVYLKVDPSWLAYDVVCQWDGLAFYSNHRGLYMIFYDSFMDSESKSLIDTPATKIGADLRARTEDLRITNALLYQLS